jgi:glutathione S-transferase
MSLGKYGGANDDEAYEVDAFADLVADFRLAWYLGNWGDEKAKKMYEEEKRERFLTSINRYLTKTSGPYILGNEPSYADFSLLGILLDAKPDIDAYPHIKIFTEAIKARPGVAKYLNK